MLHSFGLNRIPFLSRILPLWRNGRPSLPHQFSQAGFKTLDPSAPVEEERYSHYSPTLFYPVRIGEVLNSRYQVVGKLGYGSNSTVWLCRDLQAHEYVTAKVGNSDCSEQEVKVYQHIDSIETKHAGRLLVRKMEDHFYLSLAARKYPCLVHKPLSISLQRLRRQLNGRMPLSVLKPTLLHIFLALDFLHTEADMVHTDLQEKNILLGLDENDILESFERDEQEDPTPHKASDKNFIYQSRELKMPNHPGRPVLTDFGEARFGQTTFEGDIQPFQYRAPEVLFELPWDKKVDIWNIGALMWDLLQGKNLFQTRGPDGKDSTPQHVAQMIALLGPPPPDLLQSSPRTGEFYEENGNWKGLVEIPSISLEESITVLEGVEKDHFICFARKMLHWDSKKRYSARELYEDPWLRS